ncbi:hypothetical protein BX600DRAFT_443788 [Xylariales sp. PMI_506]|nr:hypothetical protein BX600DRAFT_443788 [Xylariales sp. PMI_506]
MPAVKTDISQSTQEANAFLKTEEYPFPGIKYIPEDMIFNVVTFINLAVAIWFLVAAAWILWLTEDLTTIFPVRLAVLTVFVLLFAAWISLMTSAKRSEVFGATAAYAAVLVVFLGS